MLQSNEVTLKWTVPNFFNMFSLFCCFKNITYFHQILKGNSEDVLHQPTSSKWGALLAAAVLRSQRKGAYLRGIASNPRALSTRGCWSHHRSGVFFGRSCGVVGGWGGLIISSWVQGGSVGLETKECHRSRILSLKEVFFCVKIFNHGKEFHWWFTLNPKGG